jgi:hypothetical protein
MAIALQRLISVDGIKFSNAWFLFGKFDILPTETINKIK